MQELLAHRRHLNNMKNLLGYGGMLLSLWSCGSHQSTVKGDETVVLFPTSGYMNANHEWLIPLHGWIFEYERESL